MTTALFFMILAILLAIAIAVNAIRVANKDRKLAEANIATLTEVNAELRQDLNDVRLRETALRTKAIMFRGKASELFYDCFIKVESIGADPDTAWPKLEGREISDNGKAIDLMVYWRKEILSNCIALEANLLDTAKERDSALVDVDTMKKTNDSLIEEYNKTEMKNEDMRRCLTLIKNSAVNALDEKPPSKNEYGPVSLAAQAVVQHRHLSEEVLKAQRTHLLKASGVE